MSLKTLEHSKECGISLGELMMLENKEHEELQCLCMDYMREYRKLRELVHDLFRCAYGTLRDLAPSCYDSGADGCGLDCTENGERCCMAVMERRVRELGIEVDG